MTPIMVHHVNICAGAGLLHPSIQPWAMHLQQWESPIASLSRTQHLCDLLTCFDVRRANYRTGERGGWRGEEMLENVRSWQQQQSFSNGIVYGDGVCERQREGEKERERERGDDNDQMSDWNLIHLMRWSSMLSCACSSHCRIRDLTCICKWCETSTSKWYIRCAGI